MARDIESQTAVKPTEYAAVSPLSEAATPSKGAGVTGSPRVPATRAQSVAAALLYMSTAVLLIFFNKAALSHYKFTYVNVITLAQLLVCLALLIPARLLNTITFFKPSSPWFKENPAYVPLQILKIVAPLSFIYLLYMVVGMLSMVGVNLPMFTTLRRTTAAFTMTAEWLIEGKRHSRGVEISVGVICLGAVVAGVRDLEFNLAGYGMVFLSNVMTAVYLATISKYDRLAGLSSFGLMWANSLLCIPLLLVLTCVTGEMKASFSFPLLDSGGFQAVMIASCFMAFALNYSIFLNTSINSALTQTICGNLKDGVVILVGYFTFGGVQFEIFNFSGMMLGMIGSCTYAYIKLNENPS